MERGTVGDNMDKRTSPAAAQELQDNGQGLQAPKLVARTVTETSGTTSTSHRSSGTSSGTYGNSAVDSVSDLIDKFSSYIDGVLAIFSKDTNTSKGEDLKKEEPLTIAPAETNGRLFANAAFEAKGMSGVDKLMLSDAYDFTQAVTRLSKEYSRTRADYYKEAQEYNKIRSTRMEYKKASFTATMNVRKKALEKASA